MVSAPASWPCPVSSLRSCRISSMTPALVAVGEVCGARETGSNAASPSARYRAMRRLIQPCETPYVRATSDCEDPARTAVMTRRRFDTTDPAGAGYADDLRHAIPMSRDTPFRCPETRHCPGSSRTPSGARVVHAARSAAYAPSGDVRGVQLRGEGITVQPGAGRRPQPHG